MSAIIAARPTTYRGIQMRSRLEARYAAWLDANDGEWAYEPRAYANESGQYLPDFELPGIEGVAPRLFVEVRPTVERALLALPLMQIIWDSEPGANLLVTIPDSPVAWAARGAHERRWKVIPFRTWS